MAATKVPLLNRLVASSVTIANQAGNVIRDVLKTGDLQIVQKEHAKDLQTEADRAAQRCIISSLAAHFPSLTIIGEEGEDETASEAVTSLSDVAALDLVCPAHLANLSEDQIVVWVDPLDGTSEFTQGLLDHVTVLIGIASEGKAIAGIIHQPYFNYQNKDAVLGRTIWGVIGDPAAGGKGVMGGMTVKPPSAGARVITTTRSHSNQTVNDAVTACQPTEVLRVGGAGHKVLLLLEGIAHAYVFASPGCKKWDTCAPQAVLEAVGGRLTDIAGQDIRYHKEVEHRNSSGVLATAPSESHANYLGQIPASVTQALVPK